MSDLKDLSTEALSATAREKEAQIIVLRAEVKAINHELTFREHEAANLKKLDALLSMSPEEVERLKAKRQSLAAGSVPSGEKVHDVK